MEKKIEEKWKDKATLQQIFFILIGAMVAVNATGLGYKGPIFGTWYGDVLVVIAFIMALVYMRIHDQAHQRLIEDQKQWHEQAMLRLMQTKPEDMSPNWVQLAQGVIKGFLETLEDKELVRRETKNRRESDECKEWEPP